METITFTCKVITPMFLAGADGQTPELRAPSIKGAMRFWWRAMHGHLPLGELHDKEGRIFGDNANRSCFTIRIANRIVTTEQFKPVPHKDYKISAIQPESSFDVVLGLMGNRELSFDQLSALFELCAVLGGFGKRSRRAMGGFRILSKQQNGKEKVKVENLNVDYILNLIGCFSKNFQKNQNKIINIYQGTMQKFPWIKQIEVGEDKGRNIPVVTSNITHQLKGKYRQAYEPNLGHAFRGRFASPVIVSVFKDEHIPIITTLNTVPDRGDRDLDTSIQNEFKRNIL